MCLHTCRDSRQNTPVTDALHGGGGEGSAASRHSRCVRIYANDNDVCVVYGQLIVLPEHDYEEK